LKLSDKTSDRFLLIKVNISLLVT